MSGHISVLQQEVLELLQPERGGVFIDATLGMGGHAEAMLARGGDKIKIIGIDQDPHALEQAKARLGEKIEYVYGNFSELAKILKDKKIKEIDGILMDLGVSSYQLDTPERGFSFQENGPLDMRMDPEGDLTAADIVNTWPEAKLVDLLFKYGEERLSRKITRFIIEKRYKTPFEDTASLAEVIVSAYPPPLRYKHPHPATRVFQALRIAVNQELEVLEDGIEVALESLAIGGRVAIISFHSLEDRIVKHRFREKAASGEFQVLTKKPLLAEEEERQINSRSRSAKLRGIERLSF